MSRYLCNSILSFKVPLNSCIHVLVRVLAMEQSLSFFNWISFFFFWNRMKIHKHGFVESWYSSFEGVGAYKV